MPQQPTTIEELLPFAREIAAEYSGWAMRPLRDATELAAVLRKVADELDAGIAQPLGTGGHIVHYYLGTDVDGTPNVNLDTGHRSVALGLRYCRVVPGAAGQIGSGT